MTMVQRSPLRFILFLVVLAALLAFVMSRWEAYQEQAFDMDWETMPVVMPQDASGAGDDSALAGDEVVATMGPVESTSSEVGEIRAVADDTFFVVSRLEREQARSQRLELLEKIVDNPHTDAEARRQAEQELVELTRKITQETEIESLIQARGYEQVLVYLYDEAAVVIVQADELTDAQAAQAADAVAKVAGVPFPAISVMARSN